VTLAKDHELVLDDFELDVTFRRCSLNSALPSRHGISLAHGDKDPASQNFQFRPVLIKDDEH
jgi:hypothetical protein